MSIFLAEFGFIMFKLKSPVIVTTAMPVSIARLIESSVLER